MNRVFKLVDLRGEWPDNPLDLLTRERGRQAFRRFEQELKQVSDDETLVLDCSGIPLMDSSFLDESILNLFQRLIDGVYGNRFVAITHISQDALYNMAGATKNRGMKAAIPVKNSAGWTFIGPKIGERWEANLDAAAQRLVRTGELTARDLADQLHISINSASNRLRRLHALRLAKRTPEKNESGLSHRYTPIA
jgi:hypothetical protein